MKSMLMSMLWGLTFLLTYVTGYPTRIPHGACISMFPVGHHVSAQTSAAPYNITVNAPSNMYTPNVTLTVTISGISGASHKGLFLQARRANCSGDLNDAPIGTFSLAADMTESYKLKSCGDMTNSSVTHSNNTEKTDPFQATWMAPAMDVGPIYFRATVVKIKEEFWMSVNSPILSGPSAGEMQGEICSTQIDAITHAPPVKTTTESGADSLLGCLATLVLPLILLLFV